MSSQVKIIGGVWDKLDNLPLSFQITDADIAPCLSDTLREMKLSDISNVPEDSNIELYVELRTVWWVLFRFKNTSAINFKYNTGNSDGKSVDKTMISSTISDIMDDINDQFMAWFRSSKDTSSGIWNVTRRQSTRLQEG
jgi:hypothetical protein